MLVLSDEIHHRNNLETKNIVDFIGIGAQKAGTSWLFRRLEELPEFSLPPIKELHYFDRNRKYDSPHTLAHSNFLLKLCNFWWLKNLNRRLLKNLFQDDKKHLNWYFNYFFSNYNDSFYLKLFEGLNGIKGEVSPSYSMLDIDDIQKIHELLPQLNLVLLLRDPIDRAWSHYNYINPKDKILDLAHFKSFINAPKQEKRSNYLEIIENYTSVFPKEQLFIGYYDQIKVHPQQLLENVVSFLGGDAKQVANYCKLDKRNNVNKDKLEIPEHFLEELKIKYEPLIKALAISLKGYAVQWQKHYFE